MNKSNKSKEQPGCLRCILGLFVFLYALSAIVEMIDDYKTPPSVRCPFYRNRRTTSASYSTWSGAKTTCSSSGVQSVPSYHTDVDWRDDYEVPDDDPEITFDDYDDYEGDEDYD